MINDKRFVKFNFEKPNDNVKFKDNEIHILFYSEKDKLLSDNFNADHDTLIILNRIIKSDTGNLVVVRSEKGNFLFS